VAVVDGDTHLSKWIIEQRRLNVAKEYLDMFKHLIPRGGIVIDAGACLGDHTSTYSELVGPNGQVIAFEPNKLAYECLAHNMKAYPNVTPVNAALGRKTGTVGVENHQNKNLGMARVVSGGDVAMYALDDVIKPDSPRIEFIKMDIEGYEPDAIAGAMKTLARHRPVMLIEIQKEALALNGYTNSDIIDPLQSLGYDVKPAESWLNFDMVQIDVLCTPR
jgi:FkbM family methyltransferase